jgi:hypothetical protein
MAIGAMIQLHTKSSVSNAERVSFVRVILITVQGALKRQNNIPFGLTTPVLGTKIYLLDS